MNECTLYSNVERYLSDGKGIAVKTTGSGREGNIADGFHRELIPLDPENLKPQFAETEDGFCLIEPITPPERMIILGGGHISLSLCQFASACGFDITIVDDRPAFANAARFPMAHVICDTFEAALEQLTITPYDYVIIVTRGHRHDGDCLRMLWEKEPPAYLGMIGSRRRVAGLKDVLEEEGISRKWLDNICTPIGLKIGAITPAEIAVSIMAEVISYKRMPEIARHPVNDSDLENDMITYLAKNTKPQAVVTIVSSMGSTPRAAGAKMSVNIAGQVTGTIGGGCAEGAIIQTAVRMIGTGTYRLVSIDMSGEVAESEGMVCGGVMTVLIEDGSR